MTFASTTCALTQPSVRAGKEKDEGALRDIMAMLKSRTDTSNMGNPQLDHMLNVMKRWGKENGVPVA